MNDPMATPRTTRINVCDFIDFMNDPPAFGRRHRINLDAVSSTGPPMAETDDDGALCASPLVMTIIIRQSGNVSRGSVNHSVGRGSRSNDDASHALRQAGLAI